MDLREFGAALLRRWYLTIAVVVVALLAGIGVSQLTGARYTATATAVLIPPQSTVENAARTAVFAPPNPLLYLSGLSQARDVMARAMSSQQMADELTNRVPGATLTASGDSTSSAPIMSMSVEAKSESGALAGLGLLRERLPGTLASLQQQVGVPQNNWITALPLTTDDVPKTDRKAQIQAMIVAFAFVLVAGLLALAYIDGVAQGRRHGRRSRRPAGSGSASPGGSGKRDDTRQASEVSGSDEAPTWSDGEHGQANRDVTASPAVESTRSSER